MTGLVTLIQTEYRGHLFRSRLEARWAVFFDTLGILYRYESEGFELTHGREKVFYLPDFKLPEQRMFPKPLWVEIKGDPTPKDSWKCEKLAVGTGIRATMLGDVPMPENIWSSGPGGYTFNSADNLSGLELTCYFPSSGSDLCYSFCECPFCHSFGFEFDGRSARIGCLCLEHEDEDKNYNNASQSLVRAYKAARRARFEHGESPV